MHEENGDDDDRDEVNEISRDKYPVSTYLCHLLQNLKIHLFVTDFHIIS